MKTAGKPMVQPTYEYGFDRDILTVADYAIALLTIPARIRSKLSQD